MKRRTQLIDRNSSRLPLERMLKIHQTLQSNKYPNAASLAAELEVSTKSIHRDLVFMRDRLELPINYDPSRAGYYYTAEVSAFPTMQISEGEVFALLIAEKALQQYRGTSFEKPLLSAIKKLKTSLPETVTVHLAEWEQTISFRTSAEPIVNLEIIDELARATAAGEQIKILYRKPGAKPEERTIDPYHLANINGEWFLFAYDHLRKSIRTFVPARILRFQKTGTKFRRPLGFSPQKILRDSFGVVSGKSEHEVRIRFDAQVADYVREKRWHPSQQIKELKRGELELRMKLSGLAEVTRWVLSWGGNATVIAPRELASAVRSAARAILKN